MPGLLTAETAEPAASTVQTVGDGVYALTFGCQMNTLDTELALSVLTADGLKTVESPDQAGIVIVNTCSIREQAENKAYSFLGRMKKLKRANPELIVAVVGCMAQKDGETIFRRAPYVDIVAGTRHFTRINDYVDQVRAGKKRVLALDRDEEVRTELRAPSIRDDVHSAYLAVMRGCDHHCTFCVVPNTRGIETSKPLADAVREAEILVGDGVKEITLLGQNIDSYGKRLTPKATLADLIRAVAAVPGLERLRFITSHPGDVKPDLMECFREGAVPNLMPYFHFPAQSGSDAVLKRMRRGYTHARYLELVAAMREIRPDIGIAGDTIVGFCGETEEDFQATMALHRAARYQQCFMFTYSERGYTPAIQMGLADDVPDGVKRERHARLMELQREIQAVDNPKKIGKEYPVLVDGPSKTDKSVWSGRNPQNQVVHFKSGRDSLSGATVTARITSATDLALYGELV
jgi:tRNA-2-methylthio-N6-dimethylallyladenosine synthase